MLMSSTKRHKDAFNVFWYYIYNIYSIYRREKIGARRVFASNIEYNIVSNARCNIDKIDKTISIIEQ